MIAPFLAFVPDNCFKTVCQMKWVNSITLPQSESIIPTTSERYSPPLCLELNTKTCGTFQTAANSQCICNFTPLFPKTIPKKRRDHTVWQPIWSAIW